MNDAEALDYATKMRRSAVKASAVAFCDWAIRKAASRLPTQPVAHKPKRDRAAYMRDIYRPKLRVRLERLKMFEAEERRG